MLISLSDICPMRTCFFSRSQCALHALRQALKGSSEDEVDAVLDRVMMLFRCGLAEYTQQCMSLIIWRSSDFAYIAAWFEAKYTYGVLKEKGVWEELPGF